MHEFFILYSVFVCREFLHMYKGYQRKIISTFVKDCKKDLKDIVEENYGISVTKNLKHCITFSATISQIQENTRSKWKQFGNSLLHSIK